MKPAASAKGFAAKDGFLSFTVTKTGDYRLEKKTFLSGKNQRNRHAGLYLSDFFSSLPQSCSC